MGLSLKRFLFIVIAVASPFVVANEVIRWVWYRNYWYNQIMVRDWDLISSLKPDFHGRLLLNMSGLPPWRGKNASWQLNINSQGIRGDKPVPERSSGRLRILCLGDSITFGLDVDDDLTYPSQLEKILRQAPGRGGEVEVINAGVVAYSSRQGLVYFDQRLGKLEPDLVIWGFGFNDPHSTSVTAFRSDKKLIPGDVRTGWKKVYASPVNLAALTFVRQPLFAGLRDLSGMIKLTSLIKMAAPKGESSRRNAGRKPVAKPEDFNRSLVPPADFLENLEQFVWLARQNKFHILFYIPYRVPAVYRSLVLDVANNYRIPVVDFSTKLEQYRMEQILKNPVYAELFAGYRRGLDDQFLSDNPIYLMTSDGIHPNSVANRIIAEQIAAVILSPPASGPVNNLINPGLR